MFFALELPNGIILRGSGVSETSTLGPLTGRLGTLWTEVDKDSVEASRNKKKTFFTGIRIPAKFLKATHLVSTFSFVHSKLYIISFNRLFQLSN